MPGIIALIGRPNVGKSTLFNRLIRSNRAITHDRPGVTRDRMNGICRRGGYRFGVVDTGGVTLDASGDAGEGPEASRGFETEILAQAKSALEDADAVLLVMDGKEGLTPLDERLADFLRTSDKPLLVAVNKVDASEQEDVLLSDFYSLGLNLAAVSASHGYRLDDLVDAMYELLPDDPTEEDPLFKEFSEHDFGEAPDAPELVEGMLPAKEFQSHKSLHGGLRLAMLGRPNAGKSSMVNALIGENRMIVSDIAGTTRDSVDVAMERTSKKGEHRYVFVDTAGVRRRAKIQDAVERFSVSSALKSARKADVALLVLDATEGMTIQDKRLLAYLDKEKIPFVTLINKVDLVPREHMKQLKQNFKDEFRIANHVPVMYVSAKEGRGVKKILPKIEQVWEQCGVRVSTGLLNRLLRESLQKHQPPTVKRRRAKFYYMTQADTMPPTFVFFVNNPDLVKASYARYLENRVRRLFEIDIAPVALHFRSSRSEKK